MDETDCENISPQKGLVRKYQYKKNEIYYRLHRVIKFWTFKAFIQDNVYGQSQVSIPESLIFSQDTAQKMDEAFGKIWLNHWRFY